MPVPSGVPINSGSPSVGPAQSYTAALTLLASLFFMWGFITVINNTLLPHLRSVFDLSYTQTTLIESVWFIAYFVASIPSAKLIERIGYQKALVVGLLHFRSEGQGNEPCKSGARPATSVALPPGAPD